MLWIFWVYLAIAVIGLIILIIIAMTGGFLDVGSDLDLDVGDFDVDYEIPGGPSPLSLPVMLFTISMVGAIGAVLSAITNLHWLLVLAIAVGGGVISAIVAFFAVSKVLTMFSSNAVENINRLKGKAGMVTVPIEAGKEGQVVFSSKKTGRFTVAATAGKDIATDTVVVVTEIVGDIVEVKARGKASKGKKKSSGGEKKRGGKKKKK